MKRHYACTVQKRHLLLQVGRGGILLQRFGQCFAYPLAHLCRRRIGECDDQEFVYIHRVFRVDYFSNYPLDKHSRLARTCRCCDKEVAASLGDSLKLFSCPIVRHLPNPSVPAPTQDAVLAMPTGQKPEAAVACYVSAIAPGVSLPSASKSAFPCSPISPHTSSSSRSARYR